jgi:hypothetical protein
MTDAHSQQIPLPPFYGIPRFITVFTRPRNRSLSWARCIQSIPSHPIISLRSILTSSPHLCLGLPSGLPLRVSQHKHYTHFSSPPRMLQSRDSSFGIALGYGLDDRGSRVRFPAGAENFSLHHRVLNGSGALPAPYPMGTRGSFPRGKAAGA